MWSSHGCSFARLITNCSLSNFCNYLILSSFVPLFLSLMYSVLLSFFIPLPFLSSSFHISLSLHLSAFPSSIFYNAEYLVTTYFDDWWLFHLKKINRSKPYVCMCVSICVFMQKNCWHQMFLLMWSIILLKYFFKYTCVFLYYINIYLIIVIKLYHSVINYVKSLLSKILYPIT